MKAAMAVIGSKKRYIRSQGSYGYCSEQFRQVFFSKSAEKSRREGKEILKQLNLEIVEFNRKFAEFCEEYALNCLEIKYRIIKYSDYYLALMTELLREMKATDNYAFVFMGVPCRLETFAEKIPPLRLAGNILLTIGISLFFIVMPAVLLTQPFGIPAIAAFFLIMMALTLFIGYCGAMIRENQMPFTAEDPGHPCLITQLFGHLKPIEDIEFAEEFGLQRVEGSCK